MALELTCPHCSRRLAIRQPQPGSTIHCPVCTGQLIVPDTGNKPGSEPSPSCWWVDHPDKTEPPRVAEIQVPWYRLLHHRILAGAVLGTLLLVALMVSGAAWISRPAMAPPVADLFTAPEPVEAPLARAYLGIRAHEPPAMEAEGVLSPVAEAMPVPADFGFRWPAVAENQPAAGVPAKPQAPPPVPPVVKRRQRLGDEELRKQLLNVPEVALDVPGKVNRSSHIQTAAMSAPVKAHFTPQLLAHWSDLQGMPYRMGNDCQLGKEPAEAMQAMSRKLRAIMAESMNKNGDNRLHADYIADKISEVNNKADFENRSAVPCLMQMLQPESRTVRQVMVSQLAKIKHRSASEALAKVAVFDLADDVREEAIAELAKRSREEYRTVLVAALRYPWAPAADHAAEALVALQDKQAVPALVKLLDQPDPSAPRHDPTNNTWSVHEVVRVNHLSNCLMCHAPSRARSDLVRGRVPSPGQPLPPMTQYYEDDRGIFVRADIT
jgi:hypothetical protein